MAGNSTSMVQREMIIFFSFAIDFSISEFLKSNSINNQNNISSFLKKSRNFEAVAVAHSRALAQYAQSPGFDSHHHKKKKRNF
jgi:hypothetical protein